MTRADTCITISLACDTASLTILSIYFLCAMACPACSIAIITSSSTPNCSAPATGLTITRLAAPIKKAQLLPQNKMVPPVGVEPTTFGLRDRYSTFELRRRSD